MYANTPKTDLLLSAAHELPPLGSRTPTDRLRTFRFLYYDSPAEDILAKSAAHAEQVRVADELPHTIVDLTAIDEYIASWAR